MKRILFISSRPLYPIVGGDQIRTVQQLELLKSRFEVDVLYLTPDDTDKVIRENSAGVGKVFRFKVTAFKAMINASRFIFNSLPIQANYYYDNRVKKAIDQIIEDYDAVFCNNIRTAEYVRNKSGIVKYLDFVDAISMNYDKAKREAKGVKKLIYSIDFKRLKKYEKLCLDSFDSCAIISDIDKMFITQ